MTRRVSAPPFTASVTVSDDHSSVSYRVEVNTLDDLRAGLDGILRRVAHDAPAQREREWEEEDLTP